MENKKIYVYSQFKEQDTFVGTLVIYENFKNKTHSTFEYSDEWLNYTHNYPLGIDLPLKQGRFYCNTEDTIFRLFSLSYSIDPVDFYYEIFLIYADKSNLLSNKEGYDKQVLYDWFKTATCHCAKFGRYEDHKFSIITNLLYENDYSRSGSIRFKLDKNGEYIQNLSNIKIPTIENIDRVIEIFNSIKTNSETTAELEQFHAFVSGLNGRKPKTHILNKNNDLCIAKLSAITDDLFSEYGVELLALKIAKKLGIQTQEFSIETTNKGEKFLLIKRFDRNKQERIPFHKLSAFITKNDVEDTKSITKAIKLISKNNSTKNLREFFKRSLFRIAITNTNAQIPNTGFLYNSQKGWLISPEYDTTCGFELRRTPYDMDRVKDFYIKDTRKEIQTLINNRHYYKVTTLQAKKELLQLKKVLLKWKPLALEIGFEKENLYRIKIFKACLNGIKFE